MAVTITDIFYYPVKGLNAMPLDRVELAPGQPLPNDRRFALAHGSTNFDPSAPKWMPKTNFLMLMRDEKLAQLRARFDGEQGELTVERNGKRVLQAKITEPLGRTMINQFFASFMAGATRGTPKVVEAPGHMFSDVDEKVVSLINRASVRDLERVMRVPVNPLRFRANVYFDDCPAWQERQWIGQEITIGETRLVVRDAITRCAATNVDPETAERDLNVPLALERGFGHVTMGVYAAVKEGGTIANGDNIAAPS